VNSCRGGGTTKGGTREIKVLPSTGGERVLVLQTAETSPQVEKTQKGGGGKKEREIGGDRRKKGGGPRPQVFEKRGTIQILEYRLQEEHQSIQAPKLLRCGEEGKEGISFGGIR